MTDDGVDRAREIFKEAIDLSGAERDAFVETASAGDESLRDRVDRLLQAFDSDASKLGETNLTAVSTGTRIGSQIGRFRILEMIGEGGFGQVWLAEQTEPVRRRVAIKIIKRGMDSAQVVARFEAERQALAMMEHPNIARVYDGGETDEGRLYFVMELVKGMPITEYCERRKLGLAERIRLFGQVCAGVQHAHQKGVIHRDLKPTNVLVCEVDDKPVAKVIDFGIAKALERPLTDKTLFTEFRQFIGTPEYMSPEQAELSLIDVDTRSDVYALGVMLYELLAGKPPFDPKSLRSVGFDEMRRIIREEEPPPPSSKLTRSGSGQDGDVPDPELAKLGKLVRGELDWIVQRAMAKERDRRYASANDLEEDLSRYLRNEPVRAGRPGRLYRARRFVRRNRLAVSFVGTGIAALLVIAVLLGVGLIVLSGNYDELQQAQTKERAANQQVEASLAARTAALAEVESAQTRTESALKDAERARDRAEDARNRLDGQVSAMHIARAAELTQSEEMQAIAQLDLVPERNRNWAWKTLRSKLPTRTEIGRFEDAIICDVTRQGDRALVLSLDDYTLRCDVVSLPNGELISNLYSESYEGRVPPVKRLNGQTLEMPELMVLNSTWNNLLDPNLNFVNQRLFVGMSFSMDGRRVVLPNNVFDYFRTNVLQMHRQDDMLKKARAQSNVVQIQKQIEEAMASGLDVTDMEEELRTQQMAVDAIPGKKMSVSHVLLSIFDASSGDLVATMPRTTPRRTPFDGADWVADDAATRLLTIQRGDSTTGDALLMLLVDEGRVLESAPLKLQNIEYWGSIPLTISADGELFAVGMEISMSRREQSGVRHEREGDGDWVESEVFRNLTETRHRVGVGQVVDGAIEINEVLLREVDLHENEQIQELAFTADNEGLFVLETRRGFYAYRPAKTWWNQDDNLLSTTGSTISLFEDQVSPNTQFWFQRNMSPPSILRPVGEDAVLVSNGSRIVQVDLKDSADDGVAAFEVVKRFDLGDARILLAEPPTKEHEASLISWSDQRITRVHLGERVAVVEEVDHAYPRSGAFVRRSDGELELVTPSGEVVLGEADDSGDRFAFLTRRDVPWSVSPSGRYAIMSGGLVIDVETGERHVLAEHRTGSGKQVVDLQRLNANTFKDGCWIHSDDGRELFLTLLQRSAGNEIAHELFSNDPVDPSSGVEEQAGGITAVIKAARSELFTNGIYSWDVATGAFEGEITLPMYFVDGGMMMSDILRSTRSGDLFALAGEWQKLPTLPTNRNEMDSFITEVMKGTSESKNAAFILFDGKTGEVVLRKQLPGALGGLDLSPDGSEVACYLGGSEASETARVVLVSKDPDESWLVAEPDIRTNNVTDAYLSETEVRGISRPTPILSYSPDGSVLSLLLESRIDLMDPRSNTWLLSWDLEAILATAGLSLQADRLFPSALRCAAFGPNGRELNIWADVPLTNSSSILIRIHDAPLSETEAFTPGNEKTDVSSRPPLSETPSFSRS